MPISDLYSKRQKRLRGETIDVYQYTDLPKPLRNQIIQIVIATLGETVDHNLKYIPILAKPYETIAKTLCREYGVMSLTITDKRRDPYSDIIDFIAVHKNVEQVIDAVELLCRFIEGRDILADISSEKEREAYSKLEKPTEAIEEINARFLEHGVGFQYQNQEVIRIDSLIIHKEVVKPALALLSEPYYVGPNDEYMSAHEHFRKEEYKECFVDCLKAFESTMKCICDKRQWVYNKNIDTAKDLIAICFQNSLIPSYLQTYFTSLRTNLESGIPTLRNKNAGHGQGLTPTSIPQYLASYLIHLTATTILMLVEAEKALPQ